MRRNNTKAKMLSAVGEQADRDAVELYFWIDYSSIEQSDKLLQHIGMQVRFSNQNLR